MSVEILPLMARNFNNRSRWSHFKYIGLQDRSPCSAKTWGIGRIHGCCVPLMLRPRRPGHKPCLPRIKRRAVSRSMV